MRNVEARIRRLEEGFRGNLSGAKFLTIPREIPRESWDQYVKERTDGRPMMVFPERIPLSEAIEQVGSVEIYEGD
jgi:hypothetical protein